MVLGQQFAFCFYNSSTGTWLNRDPVGEPGFELLRGRPGSPLVGASNRYLFANHDAVNYFDALGLDVYILRTQGSYRHEAVLVGSEKFGFLYTDFAPKDGPAVSAEGTIHEFRFTTPLSSLPKISLRAGGQKKVIKISTGDAKMKTKSLIWQQIRGSLATVIEQGLSAGLSAQRIYQDLVAGHGFTGAYDALKRFVHRLAQDGVYAGSGAAGGFRARSVGAGKWEAAAARICSVWVESFAQTLQRGGVAAEQ